MSLEYQQYRDEWQKLPEACIVSPFPLHLDVELTNRCNQKCEMCPHHGPDRINERIPQDMDFGLYKKIIDEGSEKGLKAIKLNYGGEPLLYPHLAGAISYAKEKGILDVRLNTNGFFENLMRRLFNLDLLILTDYEDLNQEVNLKRLREIREDQGWKNPRIQIKSNNPEKWKDIADEIVPNVYFEYNLEQDFHPSTFKCTQPWQRLLVLADGQVCSCSCGLLIDNKIIGDARVHTIEELWTGKQMKFVRFCHESGESHLLKQCRMCPARKEYIKGEGK